MITECLAPLCIKMEDLPVSASISKDNIHALILAIVALQDEKPSTSRKSQSKMKPKQQKKLTRSSRMAREWHGQTWTEWANAIGKAKVLPF